MNIGLCDDCGEEEVPRSRRTWRLVRRLRLVTIGGLPELVEVWLCPRCREEQERIADAHYEELLS